MTRLNKVKRKSMLVKIKLKSIIFNALIFSAIGISAEILAKDWMRSTGNVESHRFAKDSQINGSNVNNLSKEFTVHFGKAYEDLTVQSSPIFCNDKLVLGGLDTIIAVNPSDGSIIWKLQLDTFSLSRGLTIDEDCSKIYRGTDEGMLQIDANSGKIIHIFDGIVSSQAPILHRGNIFIASKRNGVSSFNLETKSRNWKTSFEKNGYQARVWSGFSMDPVSGLIFVVTGSSGGATGWWRNEPNLETSVIALDEVSGEIIWTFQQIEHDIWDLDLVGNPIILNLTIDQKIERSVVALTKTGDVILLDVKNGKPIHENSFQYIAVPQSDVPREKTAAFQKKFFKPEPYSNTVIDLEEDFSHLDQENLNYVQNKLRFSKSQFFLPPSIDHDVILYGLHGGAEWFGGAIDFSSTNPSLIIPYNRDPWIIRAFYTDKISRLIDVIAEKIITFKKDPSEKKEIIPAWIPWDRGNQKVERLAEKIYSKTPFTLKDKTYIKECSSCHGISRKGFYETEGEGDLYYPPLVGSTLGGKRDFVMNFEEVKSLHNSLDIPYNISKDTHLDIFNSFNNYDNFLKKFNLLSSRGYWQILLDKDGYPATKPPWGGLAKIDLVTGKKLWDIPFGKRVDLNNNLVAEGDKVFGGVLATSTGLIFATGNPDSSAYAYNSNGEKVWEAQLPFAGSAPPMTYTYQNCQYIVFVSTGGRYLEYKENGDAVVVYKLDSCIPTQSTKS